MLSILNKLTLLKQLQNFVTNNVFWDKKTTTTQQQQKRIKRSDIKIPSRSQELNPGAIAPNADALHMHHRVI